MSPKCAQCSFLLEYVVHRSVGVNLIVREELKEKLDRKDDFKLVMVLGEWVFRAMHIPTSINMETPDSAAELLDLNDEIVVYCSGRSCPASGMAYDELTSRGYTNARRYEGGMEDWSEVNYPLEGEITMYD